MSLQGNLEDDLRIRAIQFLSQVNLKATEDRIKMVMDSIRESDLKLKEK